MTDAGTTPLSARDLRRISGWTAVIVFVLVLFGSVAIDAGRAAPTWPDPWAKERLLFAFACAVVAGVLVLTWRLIYRKPDEARWGMAVMLVALLGFLVLVWPTLWRYHDYGCDVLKTHRLTGHPEWLTSPTCKEERAERQARQ